jgi:hypothetical protein
VCFKSANYTYTRFCRNSLKKIKLWPTDYLALELIKMLLPQLLLQTGDCGSVLAILQRKFSSLWRHKQNVQ